MIAAPDTNLKVAQLPVKESLVHDCIMYNGEDDLLRMHLGVEDPVVDHFVIVESTHTFRGTLKNKLYFSMEHFPEWERKITYAVCGPISTNPWENEHHQRRWARNYLDAADHDIVLVSDADEIADPVWIKDYNPYLGIILTFDTWTYYYYLDFQMDPQEITSCRSIVMAPAYLATDLQSLREMRLGTATVKAGWHFSYLGGIAAIRKKIESFSHAEFDVDYYKDEKHLSQALLQKTDLFDRPGIGFKHVPVRYPTHPYWLLDNLAEYRKYLSPEAVTSEDV